MTTNQTIDGVPRELLERLLTDACNENWSDLNALLHSPSECRCKRYGKGNPHWPCPVHASPLAQHQVEPTEEMKEAGCQAYMDADGMIGIMHRSSMGHAYRAMRALEQPAPVAVVMSFDFEHPSSKEVRTVALSKRDVLDGMEDYFYEKLADQICQCESVGETNVVDCNCDEYVHDFEIVRTCLDEVNRLNSTRPAHANPPPGTEPSGTHHDNDGLDDMRKPK